VFSHEMGHARGRHPLVFGAFALLLILGSDLLLVNLALESELIGLGIVMGLLVLWLLAFGFLSRRFELEADLASVELLGNGRALLDALDMVGGGPAARRTTWRHFGHERRKAFLEAAAAGPEAGRRLRRTLRAWKVVLIAALLGTAAAHGWTLSGSWDEDHVVADLRLGRFDRAAHRLGEGAGVDEDLARLVERGADLGAGDWGPRTLEYEALATLAAGRRGEALDLVDLAILRGHRGLGHVRGLLGALEAIEEGPDPPIAPADLAALPPAWTPLFAPETGS